MHSLRPAASGAPPVDESPHPDAVSLYWVENLAIMAWRQPVTARVIEALFTQAEPRRKRYPHGISYVHIGRVEYAMMDGATRQALVRMGRELGNHAVALAIVVPTSGFLASTLRSICTGIMVLSNQTVELRFHAKPEEVLGWLPSKHEQASGVKLDLERVRRALVQAGGDES